MSHVEQGTLSSGHAFTSLIPSAFLSPQVPDLSSSLGPCQAQMFVLMYNPPMGCTWSNGPWIRGMTHRTSTGQQPCPWTSPLAAVYPGRHLPWDEKHQHSFTYMESKYWPWENKLKRNTCSDLRHALPQWKLIVPHIKLDSSENSIFFFMEEMPGKSWGHSVLWVSTNCLHKMGRQCVKKNTTKLSQVLHGSTSELMHWFFKAFGFVIFFKVIITLKFINT